MRFLKENVCNSEPLRGCTGCGMCACVCNVDAIKIIKDEAGFYRPEINADLCTGCSLCIKVCYRFDDKISVEEREEHESYSAVNKNDAELQSASSGAVSIELMRECLNRGYYVVGVAYDYSLNRAVTRIAKTENELEQFKGSKYFQSYTVDAFKEIVRDKSGQKYAVFGTPCQIYALSKVSDLKAESDKYLFVDIFCHGCPSLNLWDKYLEDIKNKKGIDSFDNIKFRSKTHGWHEYCFDFAKGEQQFSSSKYYDAFHELFFGMDAMNEACYDCITRSTVIKTDIRIGDFWGSRYDLDTKGVSAVIIASQKGKELFDSVVHKFHIKQEDFNEIVCSQSYKKAYKFDENRRKGVLSMLSGDDSIDTIVRKRRKLLSLKTNAKRTIKSILKHLPDFIYLRLKTKLR
ncbi:MAG: Coenzyme F420 hydrogenase/dehydrogenase, beta subunit C-terminal domain [Clostridia bacterium]|nr:Coenzyme F420 hydrogenase/dehydrogenase, beta subunit C-terminal domain [Clostridia bacterium]